MRLFLLISILIHLLICLPVLRQEDGQNIQIEKKQVDSKVKIIPIKYISTENNKKQKKSSLQSDIESKIKLSQKTPPQEEEPKNKDCNKFYYGFGIKVVYTYDNTEEYLEVTEVSKGYTGDNIGLMIGDIIIRSSKPLTGLNIEEVELLILRNGQFITKRGFRSKVCIDD